jgi:hypothetical protein
MDRRKGLHLPPAVARGARAHGQQLQPFLNLLNYPDKQAKVKGRKCLVGLCLVTWQVGQAVPDN